jgi:hypothetical protein
LYSKILYWGLIWCKLYHNRSNLFLFTVNSTSSFWMFKVKFVDSNILNFGHGIYDTNWQTTLDFNQISFISSFYTLCTNIPVVKITLWRSFYTVIWLSIICLRTIKPLNEILLNTNLGSVYPLRFKIHTFDSLSCKIRSINSDVHGKQ